MGLVAAALFQGAVAQLGERQLCKLDVAGSIPTSSIVHVLLNLNT